MATATGIGVVRSWRILAFCLVLGTGLPGRAAAEIKDYQIRRMLILKTECGVSGLDTRKVAGDGEGFTDLFVAACENVAHYPDGVEILCPDTEDERDCRMLTRKREFPHLHLLKP